MSTPDQPPATKKSSKKVWIILGVIFGAILLFCGGCFAFTGSVFNEVDQAIQEEEANDQPTEITAGEAFEHDRYSADSGWQIADDGIGDFTIEGLKVTNTGDSADTALLDFRLYNGNEVIAEISCTSKEIQPDEKSSLDCVSTDDVTDNYDTVKVSDTW